MAAANTLYIDYESDRLAKEKQPCGRACGAAGRGAGNGVEGEDKGSLITRGDAQRLLLVRNNTRRCVASLVIPDRVCACATRTQRNPILTQKEECCEISGKLSCPRIKVQLPLT